MRNASHGTRLEAPSCRLMIRYCSIALLMLSLLAPHGRLCKGPCQEIRQDYRSAVSEFSGVPAECCVGTAQPRPATVLTSAPGRTATGEEIAPCSSSRLDLADATAPSRRATESPHPTAARQRLSLFSLLRI